jgi:predicted ATP-binding protein involved in virulence
MAVVFKKVRWRNLLNTGDDFIEIDLHSHATTLIQGVNGTGKCLVSDSKINILEDAENTAFKTFINFLNSK